MTAFSDAGRGAAQVCGAAGGAGRAAQVGGGHARGAEKVHEGRADVLRHPAPPVVRGGAQAGHGQGDRILFECWQHS